uniref:No apical meristem-associated C-terminal domain-containing protein n=1 Tax=Glycine max TaxID=3847 RepID=A0A0R0K472_SOYBN
MDNNVMLNAYVIWKKDEGTNFGLEHACRLLKDQSKWLENVTENFSKRMKISAFRAYYVEAETPSPLVRPMEQKATKTNNKGKGVGTSTNPVDLTGRNNWKKEYYDILMKDTSTMSETQLKDHGLFCKIIRNKLGI